VNGQDGFRHVDKNAQNLLYGDGHVKVVLWSKNTNSFPRLQGYTYAADGSSLTGPTDPLPQ
jgi:prepilin-type processing-associated H-X9-DG protein